MSEECMRCLNCGKEVRPTEAKLFAEVFLCPTCYVQADHFYLRLDHELKSLLVLAKDAIRVALLQGKFSFPENGSQEVSKREVLEAILTMEERRKDG